MTREQSKGLGREGRERGVRESEHTMWTDG